MWRSTLAEPPLAWEESVSGLRVVGPLLSYPWGVQGTVPLILTHLNLAVWI